MSAIQIGSTIDERYEVTALLGSGATGTVYVAHDPILKRDLAIKFSKASAPGERTGSRLAWDMLSKVSDQNEQDLNLLKFKKLIPKSLHWRIARKVWTVLR